MKPQDIFFIVVLIGLIISKRPRLLAMAGIVCLLLSIPLFSFWVFFTAQRLAYYAAGFFLFSVIFHLLKKK